MTWERITGNWRGAYEAWLPTRGNIKAGLRGGIRTTVPGLERFFMTGQWVSGGGLPAVAPAARSLVKSICKRDGRPFVTSVATHPPAQRDPIFPERSRPRSADREAGATSRGDAWEGSGSPDRLAGSVAATIERS
jgi:hypothetical protein